MTPAHLLLRQWPLALCWLLIAVPAVSFTRFQGGVAFMWGSTAILIVALIRTSRRHWWAPLTACGVASFLNSGLFGIGWIAAAPFVLINLGEALVAATLMRRGKNSRELMASLSWFGRFCMAMIAAPVILAPVASVTLWAIGGDPLGTLQDFIVGHALGNLILVPIAYLLTGRQARRDTATIFKKRRKDALIVLPLVLACTCYVFWQTSWPLLFMPVMVIVLATFRLGRTGAAISLVILLAVGAVMTKLGFGPIRLSGAPLSERMVFLQFYVVSTMLTVLPIAADLHQRRKLWRRLRDSEAEFRLIAEHCTDAIMRIGAKGVMTYASPAIFELSGYRPDELIGKRSRMLVDPRDFARILVEHRSAMEHGGGAHSYSYRLRRKDGEVRWLETHARAIPAGSGIELLTIMRDVTGFKDREAALTEAALTDRLTGLPNRRALEAAIKALRPGEHCLALLDLDRFKQVNDTYGHDAGDAVLKGFADMARRLVRSHDMVARLGGEEFVILFQHSGLDQAYQVCDRMRRVLGSTPLATPSGSLRITVSGGVTPLRSGGLDAALKAADDALYRAKKNGRDCLLLAA